MVGPKNASGQVPPRKRKFERRDRQGQRDTEEQQTRGKNGANFDEWSEEKTAGRDEDRPDIDTILGWGMGTKDGKGPVRPQQALREWRDLSHFYGGRMVSPLKAEIPVKMSFDEEYMKGNDIEYVPVTVTSTELVNGKKTRIALSDRKRAVAIYDRLRLVDGEGTVLKLKEGDRPPLSLLLDEKRRTRGWRVVDWYAFGDLMVVARLEPSEEEQAERARRGQKRLKKYVSAYRVIVDGRTTWRLGTPPCDVPPFCPDPFGLASSRPVMIHEGPKAALAAHKAAQEGSGHPWQEELAKYVHVGWHGAEGGIRTTDWTGVRGRAVYVLPDNDQAGKELAVQLVNHLHLFNPRSTHIFQWPINIWATTGWDLANEVLPSDKETNFPLTAENFLLTFERYYHVSRPYKDRKGKTRYVVTPQFVRSVLWAEELDEYYLVQEPHRRFNATRFRKNFRAQSGTLRSLTDELEKAGSEGASPMNKKNPQMETVSSVALLPIAPDFGRTHVGGRRAQSRDKKRYIFNSYTPSKFLDGRALPPQIRSFMQDVAEKLATLKAQKPTEKTREAVHRLADELKAKMEEWFPPGSRARRQMALFRRHMRQFVPDARERRFVVRYISHMIFRPEVKMNFVLLLYGGQGTGKNLLTNAVGHLAGKEHYKEVEGDDFLGNFNEPLQNVAILVVNEAKMKERMYAADRLKTLVTDPTFQMKRKNIPAYTVDNVFNMVVTSNHLDAVYLEGGDRRWGVVKTDFPPPPSDTHFRRLVRTFYDEGGDLVAFVMLYQCFLRTAAHVLDFDPKGSAPFTAQKAKMRENSKSVLEQGIEELVSQMDPAHIYITADLKEYLVEELGVPKGKLSDAKIAALLDSHGIEMLGGSDRKDGRFDVREIRSILWKVTKDLQRLRVFKEFEGRFDLSKVRVMSKPWRERVKPTYKG